MALLLKGVLLLLCGIAIAAWFGGGTEPGRPATLYGLEPASAAIGAAAGYVLAQLMAVHWADLAVGLAAWAARATRLIGLVAVGGVLVAVLLYY